jgi:hypothetical protein
LDFDFLIEALAAEPLGKKKKDKVRPGSNQGNKRGL